MMKDNDETLIINIDVDVNTLRMLHSAAKICHERWTGSEPYSQEQILILRDRLYICLMDALLTSGEI